MRPRGLGIAVVLPLFVGVSPAVADCPAGLQPRTTAELVFGRDVDARLAVSEGKWRAFLESEVSPRFPDGFTVYDAAGQWRGPSGVLVHEPSKVLLLVLSGAQGEDARLAAIRLAYRARFHQDSVLLIEQTVCAGF